VDRLRRLMQQCVRSLHFTKHRCLAEELAPDALIPAIKLALMVVQRLGRGGASSVTADIGRARLQT
jgi:hypothetical protein